LGDTRTRALYVILVILSALMIVLVALLTTWWALVGVAAFLLIIPAVRVVLSGGRGLALIGVLKATSLTELATAIAFAAGLSLRLF
jgi:1,4-dihydroxy-2-naphthoate polyprenyltransferase